MLEEANEYNLEIHLLFIDFRKAFDSVEHNSIWKALEQAGRDKKVIRIMRTVYRDSKTYVKIEEKRQTLDIGRGVRQRDPFSPNLFTCLLESTFKGMNRSRYGKKHMCNNSIQTVIPCRKFATSKASCSQIVLRTQRISVVGAVR